MKFATVNFMKDVITPAQLRAARGLVNWSREELANQAGTTERTIARIELEEGAARQSTLTAIRTALEAAGVIFIQENGEGPGVRLKKEATRDDR